MKIATTKCEHCTMKIIVVGYKDDTWNETWQSLMFKKAHHELMHLAEGSDVYSRMLKEIGGKR